MNRPGEQAIGPFDALMEAAVDAIIIIDQVGTVSRFNPAAERMFGYTEAEICGQNVRVLMPPAHRERHDAYLARYRETGQAAIIGKGREEFGQRRDGEVFPMLLSVGEIRHPLLQGYIGIIRDLSDMKRAQEQVRHLEEQLLHADRLVILGELTAGIAHEINQPLTAIAAYSDAGRRLVERLGADVPDDVESIYERIGVQARRAAEVVHRLRGLVRGGAISKARHDLNEIIRNILLLFEFEVRKTGIELIFEPLEDLEDVFVDEIQIQQILVNLVKNALDALADSGQGGGRVRIRVTSSEHEVRVAVSDNGPGVPESVRAQLFESFFTTKPKGVGLGLSICKTIAAAHGGSLRYEAVQGGGSRFTLTLPLQFIG